MNPTDLDTRLAALESRAPAGDEPRPAAGHRRGRFFAPVTLAPVLVLALVATAAAGGVAGGLVVSGMVNAYPGVQNPGQPLEGARLECMTPPAAATYLAGHGFTDVVWQVETGVSGSKSGGSVQQATPPEHGYVIPAAILSDGKLHMIVDQRLGATGGGACPDLPMP
jgi:hypothetical protein